MANYEEVRVKITNTQLNKLKSTAKKKKKKKNWNNIKYDKERLSIWRSDTWIIIDNKKTINEHSCSFS